LYPQIGQRPAANRQRLARSRYSAVSFGRPSGAVKMTNHQLVRTLLTHSVHVNVLRHSFCRRDRNQFTLLQVFEFRQAVVDGELGLVVRLYDDVLFDIPGSD
jgi:hypothetical protein